MAHRAVTDDAFVLDDSGEHLTLIGGYSPTSGQYHFPLLDTCPYSGATDVRRVELSTTGTLWGWTAVTAAPPGYDGRIPYGFGVVELTEERLRVITRLTEADPSALAFGDPMRLVPDVVGTADDGTELISWAFAPSERRNAPEAEPMVNEDASEQSYERAASEASSPSERRSEPEAEPMVREQASEKA